MSLDAVFSAASSVAMVAWLALLVAPRARVVTRWVAGLVVPALLGVAYVVLLATGWPDDPRAGFGSLAQVQALFAHPAALVAGWVHYLAFDLFIGAWEARRAAELGVPRLLLAPCLLLTFFFGPAGLLLFLAVAAPRQLARRAALTEGPPSAQP